MNENDILKSISENLSDRKGSTVLSNYDVLCNNIKFANDLFSKSAISFSEIRKEVSEKLKEDAVLKEEFRNETGPLFYFRNIIPRILSNGSHISNKIVLNTLPDDTNNITLETVAQLHRSFLDYNNLVTSARQYIDSLVSDSYQLVLLDPKELNYHVLVSLNSFSKYATKSIRMELFSEDVQSALSEFEQLRFEEWANSSITRCRHKTFANKVDFLFAELNVSNENDLKEEIKNLFKFSSEFTHIGYVSTFFSSSNTGQIILGGDICPYLPSTENFSELKYRILETIIKFYYLIYLSAIIYSCKKTFETPLASSFEQKIVQIISEMMTELNTRNNSYYFFVLDSLIGSDKNIDLTCMCKATRIWSPPHRDEELFCKNCGSKFTLYVMEHDTGFIVTSAGPIKIIGSSFPDFHDLPPEEQNRLLQESQTNK